MLSHFGLAELRNQNENRVCLTCDQLKCVVENANGLPTRAFSFGLHGCGTLSLWPVFPSTWMRVVGSAERAFMARWWLRILVMVGSDSVS